MGYRKKYRNTIRSRLLVSTRCIAQLHLLGLISYWHHFEVVSHRTVLSDPHNAKTNFKGSIFFYFLLLQHSESSGVGLSTHLVRPTVHSFFWLGACCSVYVITESVLCKTYLKLKKETLHCIIVFVICYEITRSCYNQMFHDRPIHPPQAAWAPSTSSSSNANFFFWWSIKTTNTLDME